MAVSNSWLDLKEHGKNVVAPCEIHTLKLRIDVVLKPKSPAKHVVEMVLSLQVICDKQQAIEPIVLKTLSGRHKSFTLPRNKCSILSRDASKAKRQAS